MTPDQPDFHNRPLPPGDEEISSSPNGVSCSSGQHDRLVQWLVNGLELEAKLFHIGQYCGNWHASTSGRERASFHMVLRGHAYLHINGQTPIRLDSNEGVFLLKDIPHFLTPDPFPPLDQRPCTMSAIQPALNGGTGLACGFFQLGGLTSDLLMDSFPDYLLIRADTTACQATAPLFRIILSEAERNGDMSSPLIERLTEVLFFYAAREISQQPDVSAGLWAVACRPRFSPLLEHVLNAPDKTWSLREMAHLVNMSRASFCRHFTQASGQPPAQFLLQLRMKIAAQHLRQGETVTRAAEHVGYQSAAAFTRAFKKVIGEQPASFQKSRRTQGRPASPDKFATIKQKSETALHRAMPYGAG